MKYLSIWVISILIFSGCLDFLDEENENGGNYGEGFDNKPWSW